MPDVPDAPADHDRRPLGDTPPQRLGERGRTTAPERRAQQADGDRQQADTPRVRETHAVSQDELRSAKRTVQAKLTRGRALLDRLAAGERQRRRRRSGGGRRRAATVRRRGA
ncbi:hypothetical protein [Streptomyces sp. CC210A]|uniref:hypothetical protein n=1 Tax=Streptomyces sp. CC210A TaxID=2898184 RepID=UPI001F1C05A0|nr:hypothetical protein [Streptomyces sp. CC210A]